MCLSLISLVSFHLHPSYSISITFRDAVTKTADTDDVKQETLIFLMVWEDSFTFRGRKACGGVHVMMEGEDALRRASLVLSPLLSFPQVSALSPEHHPQSGWMLPHQLIFSGEADTLHCLINPLANLIRLAMHSPSQAHLILP